MNNDVVGTLRIYYMYTSRTIHTPWDLNIWIIFMDFEYTPRPAPVGARPHAFSLLVLHAV